MIALQGVVNHDNILETLEAAKDNVGVFVGCLATRKVMVAERTATETYEAVADEDVILRKIIRAAKQKESIPLQIEALWFLCNIASGNKQLVYCLIDNSTIPVLK